jgi:formate hydrogenlyase subunit 5
MALAQELEALVGKDGAAAMRAGCDGELYVPMAEDGFKDAVQRLSGSRFILANLFCSEGFSGHRGFTLFYVFERRGHHEWLILQLPLAGPTAASIEDIYPAACWYEREIRDGFGVDFAGAYDMRRLFLHEAYPEGFHPLLKSFNNGNLGVCAVAPPTKEYQFRDISGEEVYQIPVGPVHAGIIEPGHFRFSVIGETIFNLEVRMFYKHRGLEKLAEGKTPAECVRIAEAISGDETAANSMAFCSALERMSDVKVPERALHLRTVFLELERVYSHLGDLGGMVVDIAYPAGASPFHILREEVFRQNDNLTGSRFMRGAIELGGVSHDAGHKELASLGHYLGSFSHRFSEAVDDVRSATSVVDRLEKTGIVKPELVETLNLTGPTARGSGAQIDTRADHPYGLYRNFKPRTRDAGDVMARFEVKAVEIHDSIAIIHQMLKEMPTGAVKADYAASDGHALGAVEAARGQNLHWVRLKGGVVDRYKVRTASFCNWQAIEHAVMGNIIPDFPLINKSLNLSYAGCDL